MPVASSSDHPAELAGFSRTLQFPCLGFILQPTGSTRAEFDLVKTQCWKALWRNLRHSRKKLLSQDMRVRIVLQAISPVMAYRASRWPASSGRCNSLDRLQRAIVAQCVKLDSIPCETAADYVRRRAHVAGGIIRRTGTWGILMCKRMLRWHLHIQRDSTHPAHFLCNFHGDEWLQNRRREHLPAITASSWSSLAGRTATRAAPGFIQQRWFQAVAFVKDRIQLSSV